MYIELKEIDKDTLEVGDVVGVAKEVVAGWGVTFRHKKIIPVTIIRITPKRTAFTTAEMGRFLRIEPFYKYDADAEKENELAKMFEEFRDNELELEEFGIRYKFKTISDEDLPEVAEHMKAITEILEKYRKE
nr:hypothetical protein [uncultured Dorea sp.]